MDRNIPRKKLARYHGIFRREDLSPEEIDKLIEKETERLLREELEKACANSKERAT
ncbi:hypothetical protein P8X24_09310 [Pyrococcus kukulkanii]|uniref:hypothetical protein n=1 Tax=Pyrococcus kukulkanii TaxID=1609559 RepID=UPI003565DB5C